MADQTNKLLPLRREGRQEHTTRIKLFNTVLQDPRIHVVWEEI